jgi:hypothetical protein
MIYLVVPQVSENQPREASQKSSPEQSENHPPEPTSAERTIFHQPGQNLM